jgi:ribose 5-phosphate isomerase B
MKVAVASDHAGFDYKRELLARLRKSRISVSDLGVHNRKTSDYPKAAQAVAESLRARRAERGILLCGSAIGVCVAANKFPGIRAGTCHDTYSARQGVEHDDLNVLCLGARVVGIELAWEIVQSFLKARFSRASRHLRRLNEVKDLEREFLRSSRLS